MLHGETRYRKEILNNRIRNIGDGRVEKLHTGKDVKSKVSNFTSLF